MAEPVKLRRHPSEVEAKLEGAILDLETCWRSALTISHLREQPDEPDELWRLLALQIRSIREDIEIVVDHLDRMNRMNCDVKAADIAKPAGAEHDCTA